MVNFAPSEDSEQTEYRPSQVLNSVHSGDYGLMAS